MPTRTMGAPRRGPWEAADPLASASVLRLTGPGRTVRRDPAVQGRSLHPSHQTPRRPQISSRSPRLVSREPRQGECGFCPSEEPSPGSTGTSAARLPLWHNSGRSSSEPQLRDVLLRTFCARVNAAVAEDDGPLAFQWPAFSKHGAVSSPPGMPARHPGPHAPEALGAAACP